LRCPVDFGARVDSWVLPQRVMDLPIVSGASQLLTILTAHADDLLAERHSVTVGSKPTCQPASQRRGAGRSGRAAARNEHPVIHPVPGGGGDDLRRNPGAAATAPCLPLPGGEPDVGAADRLVARLFEAFGVHLPPEIRNKPVLTSCMSSFGSWAPLPRCSSAATAELVTTPTIASNAITRSRHTRRVLPGISHHSVKTQLCGGIQQRSMRDRGCIC